MPIEVYATFEDNKSTEGRYGVRTGGTDEHLYSDNPNSGEGSENDSETYVVNRERNRNTKKVFYDPDCEIP